MKFKHLYIKQCCPHDKITFVLLDEDAEKFNQKSVTVLSEWKRDIKDLQWRKPSDHVMNRDEYFRHAKIAVDQLNSDEATIVEVYHGKGIVTNSFYVVFDDGSEYSITSREQPDHYMGIAKIIHSVEGGLDHFCTKENNARLKEYILDYYGINK